MATDTPAMTAAQQRMAYARSMKEKTQTVQEAIGINKRQPVPQPRVTMGLSRAQILLAAATGRMEENVEEASIEDGNGARGLATKSFRRHTRPGSVRLFKLTPQGCVPVVVPTAPNLRQVLEDPKYSPVCFDCDSDACSGEMNECPGRAKRMVRACPVTSCPRLIYDPKPTGRILEVDEMSIGINSEVIDAEDTISNDDYDQSSTPAARTKVLMDRHIRACHASEADQWGLPQLDAGHARQPGVPA